MNMKRIVAALASVLFSFFIAQAAHATDHRPGVCLIAECREGFSMDTKNCRCVSDSKSCVAVIQCVPGYQVEPKTCRCIKDKDLLEKADSSDPSKPSSGDPTQAKPEKPMKVMPLPKNPEPKTIPEPKIPCPPQRLCYP